MILEFPQFKTIELIDKESIEKVTQKYPPCSDFNFISMWCWDIKGEILISKLNNNLVVRFTDYLTGSPFFYFDYIYSISHLSNMRNWTKTYEQKV